MFVPGCASFGKCPPESLCDPVWIVPLEHGRSDTMISGMMENEGAGQMHTIKRYALKKGYIEFAMAGNYSTIGIVQMCSHWLPAGDRWQ